MHDIIIALLSAIGGGGITTIATLFQKRKLVKKQEIQTDVQTEEIAVNTLKTALNTFNEEILKPTQEENRHFRNDIKRLSNEVTKFRKAIEKIPTCGNAANCPVILELQSGENVSKNRGRN